MVAAIVTAAALSVTDGLGYAAVTFTNLSGSTTTGFASLPSARPALELSGLALSGLIVATLGVLDDVTVARAKWLA